MQLWIRNELGLYQVNNVYVDKVQLLRNPYKTTFGIVSDGCGILHRYKTKKRALEIIDEIQECLEHSDYMILSNASAKEPNIRANRDLFVLCDDNMCQIQERPLIIYTMPKE